MDEEVRFDKFVDGKQIGWDASSIDAFTRCPRYYELSTVKGYRSRHLVESPAFGSAVHDGLEVLETLRFEGVESKDACVEAAIKYMCLNHSDIRKAEKSNLNLEAAMRAIVWRAEEHWDDNIKTAATPEGTPAIELRFEVPFEDTGFRLSGRIDRIVSVGDTRDNIIYVSDYKTTGTDLSSYYFNKFKLSNQVFAYIYACRHQMGLPVKGLMIEGIQSLVNSTRFKRAVFDVSDERIEEWKRNVSVILQQAEQYHLEGYYPQNFNGCGMFKGCTFTDVCSEEPEFRQGELDNEFVVHKR